MRETGIRTAFHGDDNFFASAEGSDNNNITETAEYVYEAYYNIHITEFFQIAPDFQYIHNAGWADADAFVIGLRAQITF